MEYEADTFAAKQVGKEAYISFLLRLDQLTEGMLSRKTTTHPILSDRIKNVEKA
jgi:Zn-dependent protease with chaperone function